MRNDDERNYDAETARIQAAPGLVRPTLAANLIFSLVVLGVLVYAQYNVALAAVGVAAYFFVATLLLLRLLVGARPSKRVRRAQPVRTPPAEGHGPSFVPPFAAHELGMGLEWVSGLYGREGRIDPEKVHLNVSNPRYYGMLRVKVPSVEVAEALRRAGFLRKEGGNWIYEVDHFPTLRQVAAARSRGA